MKKQLFIILVCLFSIGFSQSLPQTVSFDYQKTTDGHEQESASVYFDPFEGSYMFIHSPVIQRVRMISDNLLYYYPVRNIALILNNPKLTIATTPVQLFVYTGSDDLGLSDLGFSLTDYKAKNDTLIKIWELKGKKKNEYIRIEVFSLNLNVLKTISYDSGNSIIKQVYYDDWILVDHYSYPMKITIIEEDQTSNYAFDHVKRQGTVTDSIKAQFKLPNDCQIHEYTF